MFSVVYDRKIAVASVFDEIPEAWTVIDCRPLIDGPGNSEQLVEHILKCGIDNLLNGQRVCFACDYGHSRSNFLAALAICRIDSIPIETAISRIRANHAESSIKPDLLAAAQAKNKSNPDRTRMAINGGHTRVGQLLAKKIGLLCHTPLLLDDDCQRHSITNSSRHQDLLVSKQITDVLHCGYPTPLNSYESSKRSYSQLLDIAEACIASDSTLHYLSSWSIFEGTTDKEVDEKSLPQPFSLHSQARCLHEQQLQYLAHASGLKYRIYRLPCLISQSGRLPRFLAYLADSAAIDRDIYLHKYTNGYPVVPLMNEDEAIASLASIILSNEPGETVIHICGNISNAPVISMGERVAQAYRINIIETPVNRNALTGPFVSKYSFKSRIDNPESSIIPFDPVWYVEQYIRTKKLPKAMDR
jgi:nucleoside-diphosphate-sugar epimerase